MGEGELTQGSEGRAGVCLLFKALSDGREEVQRSGIKLFCNRALGE